MVLKGQNEVRSTVLQEIFVVNIFCTKVIDQIKLILQITLNEASLNSPIKILYSGLFLRGKFFTNQAQFVKNLSLKCLLSIGAPSNRC